MNLRTEASLPGILVALVLAVAGSASGQVWEASSGFSASQNPNGAWQYGWTQTLGSPFNLMTGTTTFCGEPAWIGASPYIVVIKNTQLVPVPCGTGAYPPLSLSQHPGSGNERSVVRWTAPAAGSCSIAAAFSGIDFVYPTSSDVAILHDSSVLASASVSAYGSGPSFFLSVAVQAGGTIDFAVGFGSNGNYFGDATGLFATISLNVASVGPGCGTPPLLLTTPVVLGGTATLSISNAVPTTAGVVFASAPAVAALPIGGGCIVYLDLATLVELFPFTTDPAGAWSLGVPIPTDPAFLGAQFALQAIVLPTPSLLGFDLSNGVIVTIGS